MAVTAGVMLLWFVRRGWITLPSRRRRTRL
jgi:hypothetical protein